MKIAILSDIHANLQALQAVLEETQKRGVQQYWLLGDLVDYGANPNEVLALLQSLPLGYCVGGNHDIALFSGSFMAGSTSYGVAAFRYTREMVSEENLAWMEELCLAPMQVIVPENATIVHGNPTDPYLGYFWPGYGEEMLDEIQEMLTTKNLFIGHSHLQFVYPIRGGRYIYNPGSVGQPRNGCPDAQFALYCDGEVTMHSVPYDINGAASAIRAAGLPEFLALRLYEGR